MATRGSIARLNTDGSITGIYVHLDSYLSGVGHTLINHYLDTSKIDQLMELGDLSQLSAEIGEPGGNRDHKYKHWCTAYGRDRGERGSAARIYEHQQAWLDDLGQEYNYLWNGTEWLVSCVLSEDQMRSVVQMILENCDD